MIRFSSIGDMVLTSPVLRCLKQQLPKAEIHYLTKEQFRPVIEANPYIDRIITIRNKVKEVMPELRNHRYDLLVDLHKNFRSWQVILGLRKPYGTFSKLNIRKFLLCRFNINLLPPVHIVDRYFMAVKKLGVSNDRLGLDYYIPEGSDPWKTLPGMARTGFTALVIGGKHPTKQLPREKLLEVCKNLKQPVVLLGGPEDRETGDFITGALKGNGQWSGPELIKHLRDQTAYTERVNAVVNACGVLSLHESAAVIRNADLVITHDTGLMHIAAALKKDIISVWGNTIPEFGMFPYYPADFKGRSKILEVKGLNCRPCSKIGYKACPKGHFRCMKEIPAIVPEEDRFWL